MREEAELRCLSASRLVRLHPPPHAHLLTFVSLPSHSLTPTSNMGSSSSKPARKLASQATTTIKSSGATSRGPAAPSSRPPPSASFESVAQAAVSRPEPRRKQGEASEQKSAGEYAWRTVGRAWAEKEAECMRSARCRSYHGRCDGPALHG